MILTSALFILAKGNLETTLKTGNKHRVTVKINYAEQSLPSSLLDSLNHQRADNRSKKNYNPAACGPKTTVTERQRR